MTQHISWGEDIGTGHNQVLAIAAYAGAVIACLAEVEVKASALQGADLPRGAWLRVDGPGKAHVVLYTSGRCALGGKVEHRDYLAEPLSEAGYLTGWTAGCSGCGWSSNTTAARAWAQRSGAKL